MHEVVQKVDPPVSIFASEPGRNESVFNIARDVHPGVGHCDNQRGFAAGDGKPGQSGFSDHRNRIAKAQVGVTSDMTSLWFESALLPSGWASHVRVTAANGRIERVTADVEPNDTDERLNVGIPGVPNLHRPAVQIGIAGLTER